MKKSLLSAFAVILAGFGYANAGVVISTVNVDQPANDTLLFQLPVNVDCYQDIQNYPDDNPNARVMKFQPEYIVTALDFTKGDTEKGTATLPANAKVIGLGLDGYDNGSDPTSKGIFLEVTAWCRNIPREQMHLDFLDLFDGYTTHLPTGQLYTDTVTYRGYTGYPGYICTFADDATADNPASIVDIPFGNPEDPNMPFWYQGENIYLTLWMCNYFDVHMKYRYMAYDEAECECASLMRSGRLCFNDETYYDLLDLGYNMMYELPVHRLPAFRTPYFTNDIRISMSGDPVIELLDADGAVVDPAEDGNYYSLDHTQTYTLVVDGQSSSEVTFDDIYKDVDVVVIKDVTAVEEIAGDKTIANVSYYNLAGQQSAEPVDGVNIIVTTYTDGTRTTAKVIK